MCAGVPRPTIGGMLTSRLAAHPRRTLIAVLLFVVLAGVLGGPVAGKLESGGGFVAPGADSEVAVERIEQATGTEPGPGLVLLVDRPTPERLAAIDRELANLPGVASTDATGRAGDDGLVTATIRASADDEAVAETRASRCSPAPTASRSAAAPSPGCRSARPSPPTSAGRR